MQVQFYLAILQPTGKQTKSCTNHCKKKNNKVHRESGDRFKTEECQIFMALFNQTVPGTNFCKLTFVYARIFTSERLKRAKLKSDRFV